jgi:hypothetical protein
MVSKLNTRNNSPPHSVFSIQWFCFNIGLASPCRCLLSKRSVSESQLLITAIPKLAMTKEEFQASDGDCGLVMANSLFRSDPKKGPVWEPCGRV